MQKKWLIWKRIFQKNKLRSLPGVGGTGKKIDLFLLNGIAIILVCIINIFKGLSTQKELAGYFVYVLPFIILIILNYIFAKSNWYKWNAVLYAFLGIGTILGNEAGNYSGAAFLIFSYYIYNSLKSNLIIGSMVVLSIVAKNIFQGYGITNTINLIILYAFIFAIYYILIHPKPTKPEIIYCQNLDPVTVQIIQYLADGYIYKEMVYMLELSEPAIRKRITRARELMQTKSTTELVIKCHKLDYIRYKIDKVPL